jgi:hypothetical protein
MPWTCTACATEHSDDLQTCPGCAAPKTSWTVVRDQTRTFVVGKTKVEYLRGGRPVCEVAVRPGFVFSG